MSRKFIDDHVELRTNDLFGLPTKDNQYYDPGHMYLDPVSGKRFVNEGADDRNDSLFVNWQYNALILEERFLKKPLIAADIGVTSTTIAGNGVTAGAVTTPIFNEMILLSGTNAVSSCVSFSANGDGILLTTTTAKGDQNILSGNSATQWGQTFQPVNGIVYEAQIKTGVAVTNELIWLGLKLTSTSTLATDNDQTYFWHNDLTDGGYWQMTDSTGGVDNTVATSVPVAAGTSYLFQIKVSSQDNAPRYYINGVLVGTGQPLTSTASLKPYIGIQVNTTTAAAVTCDVRSLRLVMPRSPI